MVIAKGRVIAEDGRLLVDLPPYPYPDWALHSVNLGHTLTSDDFRLLAPTPCPSPTGGGKTPTPSPAGGGEKGRGVVANVIGVIENQAPTKHLRMEVTPQDGEIKVDTGRDLAKIALVERHKATGGVTVGLVHGFGFTEKCAIATTVAHDSHHMIVVGTDEAMMAQAANKLAETQGGQVVVKDGQVVGLVELPIGGLMSNERAETVARKAATVLEGFEACGCTLNNPNMQLSLLALVVIPELRISDLGMVDVTKFAFVPVVEEK